MAKLSSLIAALGLVVIAAVGSSASPYRLPTQINRYRPFVFNYDSFSGPLVAVPESDVPAPRLRSARFVPAAPAIPDAAQLSENNRFEDNRPGLALQGSKRGSLLMRLANQSARGFGK